VAISTHHLAKALLWHCEDMTPQELAELEAHVEAMGHKYYGIFADNSGAMKVFDEIELVRDLNTIRGDRSIVKDLRYA
jgi:hypothetical protein